MGDVRAFDSEVAQAAVKLLEEGDVIVAPTDTHYTILAAPHSQGGCRRIYQVKDRDPDFPLTLFLSSPEELGSVACVNDQTRRLASEIWPGFMTLIVPKRAEAVPDHVTAGLPTVAVACHRHAVLRTLLEKLGGYGACTSANRSGSGAELIRLSDAFEQVGGRVPLLIDGGEPAVSAGNTIVDVTGSKPVLVREGVVPADRIRQLLPDLVDNAAAYKQELKRRQQSVATWRPTLNGKSALVTGAARGRGSELARVLALAGSTVFVGDKSEAGGSVVDELRAQGLQAHFLQFDVTDGAAWKRAIDTVLGRAGRLDILINNAGFCECTPFDETSLSTWELAFNVNVTGTFLGIQAAARVMQVGSSIVNVSSAFGLRSSDLTGVAYQASKGALVPLTRNAASQLAARQIRVNTVAPGLVRTPLTQHHFDDADTLSRIIGEVPLGREVDIADIADAVLFLASPLSSYLTGVILPVDGGLLTR